MKPLLLLRPEPGLSASAARARALGLEVIERPLFSVERLDWEAPDAADFDALLLTSANAVIQAGPGLTDYRGLPVHAVGSRTADAARAAGLEVASEGGAGVEALLGGLAGELRLLHLGGADRIGARSARHRVTEVAVYRAAANEQPRVPPLAGLVVAVQSPRAGARLAELADSTAQASIAAISPATAKACGGGWQVVETAEQPSDSALLARAARLCQRSPR